MDRSRSALRAGIACVHSAHALADTMTRFWSWATYSPWAIFWLFVAVLIHSTGVHGWLLAYHDLWLVICVIWFIQRGNVRWRPKP
jgi:hypothetical protein